ncbi:UvrD-helicase domain-containing protein, partial [Candidatus Poribacteria bacterium]|nr:UvrD-helicase domain-containing protein [Candidatus Poribacteria bacterium]
MNAAPKWTAAQLAAITARDRNLLVNAGAGAGKTAALVERVFRLLTDPDKHGSLDRMLIVTFTRAAAGEMRERLAGKLRAAVLDPGQTMRRHVQEQLRILPRAPISTLHSFCLNTLREHSAESGLPPDFDLMEEEEALLLRREMTEAAIETALADE